MLQDTPAGCICVQTATKRGEGTKRKDIKTACDADESGEVNIAEPLFFHFAKRHAKGASVSLCRAAEC